MRDQLQFLYERLKILGLLGLRRGDDDVFTAFVAAPGLIQHAIGLAYARRVTQKYLKTRTPALVLFRLCLQKKPFGTRSREFGNTHSDNLLATV
jgi:hypothetical protein